MPDYFIRCWNCTILCEFLLLYFCWSVGTFVSIFYFWYFLLFNFISFFFVFSFHFISFVYKFARSFFFCMFGDPDQMVNGTKNIHGFCSKINFLILQPKNFLNMIMMQVDIITVTICCEILAVISNQSNLRFRGTKEEDKKTILPILRITQQKIN